MKVKLTSIQKDRIEFFAEIKKRDCQKASQVFGKILESLRIVEKELNEGLNGIQVLKKKK